MKIDRELRDRPVAGRNLGGGRFGEALGGGPVLLVFLRHLG